METFSALLAIVRAIHRWQVNSPHKGQWRGALIFSLICSWINSWVNNDGADDLRRHRAHNDVTVMYFQHIGTIIIGIIIWYRQLESRLLVLFLAATKQLYKWYFPSVRLSVRLSVCLSVTPFWQCSHHRIIMKFSGVITNDQSKVHAKGQGQRSKVKVTEVTTQLNRFRTVTPVWIDIWWLNG